MTILRRNLLSGIICLASCNAYCVSSCTDQESDRLRGLNYSQCEIEAICTERPAFQESLISVDPKALAQLQNSLLQVGCKDIAFVKDRDRKLAAQFSGAYRMISRNCAMVDFGSPCPDGFEIHKGKRHQFLENFTLCLPEMKSAALKQNASS